MLSPQQELILFIGLQASGKSTYYKQMFYRTHVRINLDMLKTRHRESILFHACIEGKMWTVIDNTNLTKAERVAYIQPARAAHFAVHGYFFESRLEPCLTANEQRLEAEQVPKKAILSSFRRTELPSYEEGFDALYFVKKGDDGDFITDEWKT